MSLLKSLVSEAENALEINVGLVHGQQSTAVAVLAGAALIAGAIDNLAAVVDLGLRQIVGLLTPDRPPVDGVDQHEPPQPDSVRLHDPDHGGE